MRMRRNHLTFLLPLALALGLLCGLGMSAAGHDATAPVVRTAAVEPTSLKIDAAPGDASEIQDYGRRQSQNPGLSGFAGGHHGDEVVIVGAGCGCLLIAILVLVILL
jgi:hypothetical protein